MAPDFVIESKEDFRNVIAEILKWCEDDGMTFPVILCTVSSNGSILANRIDGMGGSEVLAQRFEPEGFAAPMTVMVLDQKNNAAWITIDQNGEMSKQ